MVLKVSISLHGDTIITVEASEPELYREVVGLALRELPRDILRMRTEEGKLDESSAGALLAEKGKNAAQSPPSPRQGIGRHDPAAADVDIPSEYGAEAENSFARFCASLAPLGDMRRVVVAAQGARDLLGMDGVSERELGHLFDLAGWRRPSDFVQSLRNAARSKFRWLERLPGHSGYYAATEAGKAQVAGSSQTGSNTP